MRVENQTQDVLASLYMTTVAFTRQLQNHFYKQYCGDVDDLGADFYMKFIEKRGTDNKSLLDRYDAESILGVHAQRWNAYIKTAVTRALIDESRTHPWITSSFDAMLDETGDSEHLNAYMESEPSIDEFDYTAMQPTMEMRVRHMTPQQFNRTKNKYLTVRSVLEPTCVKVMDVVMNPRIHVSTTAGMLPVYKINKEFVCAIYKGKYEEFSKLTGKPKHSLSVCLTPAGISFISKYDKFTTDESRKEFMREMSK